MTMRAVLLGLLLCSVEAMRFKAQQDAQLLSANSMQNDVKSPETEPPHAHWAALLQAHVQGCQEWLHGKVDTSRAMFVMLAHRIGYKSGQEPAAQPAPVPQPTLGEMITHAIVMLILMALTAFLYSKYKPVFVEVSNDDKKESLNGDFKHGLFSCFETPGLSLFTCCCGAVRWSDTMRMLGFMAFLYGMLVWMCVETLSLLGLAFIAWAIVVVLGTMHRQKIRAAFEMPTDNQNMFYDCLGYAFCSCCAIVQEARQVEEAKALGHEATENEMPLDLTATGN